MQEPGGIDCSADINSMTQIGRNGSSGSDLRALSPNEANQRKVNKIHDTSKATCGNDTTTSPKGHRSVFPLPPFGQTALMAQNSHLRTLQPQHDERPESIQTDNMRHLQEADKTVFTDRNILEMMSSDEEDNVQEQEREMFPSWNDLSKAHKLQVLDVVAEAYSNDKLPQLLHLNESEWQESYKLMVEREERLIREQANGERHRDEIHQRFLRGAVVTPDKFRRSLERNLYHNIEWDDDFDQTTASRLEQARAYLRHCHLDTKLLDGAWGTIPSVNAAALAHNHYPVSQRVETRLNDTISPFYPSDSLSIKTKMPATRKSCHSRAGSSGHRQRPSRSVDSKTKKPKTDLKMVKSIKAEDVAQAAPETPVRREPISATDFATAFLSAERRPGARQPKLTEKVMEAKAAASVQASSPYKRKRRFESSTTSSEVFSRLRNDSAGPVNVTVAMGKGAAGGTRAEDVSLQADFTPPSSDSPAMMGKSRTTPVKSIMPTECIGEASVQPLDSSPQKEVVSGTPAPDESPTLIQECARVHQASPTPKTRAEATLPNSYSTKKL